MLSPPQQQTFAAYIARCETCDGEIQELRLGGGGGGVIVPCGHKASIRIAPNPRLGKA